MMSYLGEGCQLKALFLLLLFLSSSLTVYADQPVVPILKTNNQKHHCQTINALAKLSLLLEKHTPNKHELNKYDLLVPFFADDIFPKYFGKKYFKLSNRNKKKIFDVIWRSVLNGKCKNILRPNSLIKYAFPYHPSLRKDKAYLKWQTSISKINTGREAIEAATKERDRKAMELAKRNKIQEFKEKNPKRDIPHKAGKLLLETPEYSIYDYKENTHDLDVLCGTESYTEPKISVVVNDHTLRLDKTYLEKISKDTLLPLVNRLCPDKERGYGNYSAYYSAYFYFKGHHLGFSYVNNVRQNKIVEVDITKPLFDEKAFVEIIRYVNKAAFFEWEPTNLDIISPFKAKVKYSEVETLAGLKRVAERGFITAELAEAIKISEAKKLTFERLIKKLAGIKITNIAVKNMFAGPDYFSFFHEQPEEIYSVAAAYGTVVSELCDEKDIPGGLETRSFTHTRTRTKYGRVLDERVREFDYRWPKDFSSMFDNFADLDWWYHRTVYLKDGEEYKEMIKVLESSGCGSDALTLFHNNLILVWKAVGPLKIEY